MHGVGAQYKVIIMRDSRADYELGIGLGLEFDRGARWREGHQFTLLQLVRNEKATTPHGGPEHRVAGWRLISPAFSSIQTHGEVVHRRRGFDRASRRSVVAEQDTRRS